MSSAPNEEQSASAPARGGESAKHRELKRLALIWAQAHGHRAAAAEVSLPNFAQAACRAVNREHGIAFDDFVGVA
jgi:hypothetical protein